MGLWAYLRTESLEGGILLRYYELTIYEPMPYALCSHYIVLTLS